MGYNIGPTVAVKGEKEYQTAMQNLRQEMKYLKAETQAATSEYDKNDTSIEALTTKSEGLKQAMGLQAQAIDEGEKALERMREQGVEPTDQAYRDMKLNVNNAKTAFNESKKEYDDVKDSLGDAAENAGDFGDNVETAGGKTDDATSGISSAFSTMGSNVSGPLGGILSGIGGVTASLGDMKTAISEADTMSATTFAAMGVAAVGIISKIADIATEWIDTARQMREEAYAVQTAYSMSDEDRQKYEKWLLDQRMNNVNYADSLGDALLAVKSYIHGLDDDTLYKVTTQANELANVFGVDINEAVKTASTMSKQFGIDTSDAMNIISETLKSNPAEASTLLSSLNEFSNQFQAMGFSAEEFGTVLSTGMENGAYDVGKVADAMKELNVRAKDGSDTTRQALVDLGLDADQTMKDLSSGGDTAHDAVMKIFDAFGSVDDAMKLNEIGTALMGSQWEDVGPDVLLAIMGIGDTMTETADTVTGAAADMADSVKTEMESAAADASTAGEEIGKNISDGIANGIRKGQISVTTAVSTTMNSAIHTAKSVNQISSPSKVYAKIGRYMAEGVALGFTIAMKESTDEVVSAFTAFKKEIESAADVKEVTANTSDILSQMAAVLSGSTGEYIPAASGVTGTLSGTMSRGGINITVNSPVALSPSEVSRQTAKTLRRLMWQ